MKGKKCPLCGEKTLQEKRGDFRMELPPNVPGGAVVVPDATWLHCEACGEDILSPELEKALNKKCGRKASAVG